MKLVTSYVFFPFNMLLMERYDSAWYRYADGLKQQDWFYMSDQRVLCSEVF